MPRGTSPAADISATLSNIPYKNGAALSDYEKQRCLLDVYLPTNRQNFEVDATFFIVVPDHAELTHLAELVDTSRLHVELAGTFPLEDGRIAFESGHQPERRPGKTVLTIRD